MAIQDFYAMIRRLNREDGVAILMVSHDLRNAVEEANKILHLQKQVLFYGPAHDYMNSQAAGHFFHEKEQGQCIPTAVCRKGAAAMNILSEMLSYPFLVRAWWEVCWFLCARPF